MFYNHQVIRKITDIWSCILHISAQVSCVNFKILNTIMQSVDWLKHHTVKSNFVIHSKAKSQQHII